MAYKDNSFPGKIFALRHLCLYGILHPLRKRSKSLRFDLVLVDSRGNCKHNNDNIKDPLPLTPCNVMTILKPNLCTSQQQWHNRFSLFVCFYYSAKSLNFTILLKQLWIQSSGLTLHPPKKCSESENIHHQGVCFASLDSLMDKIKCRQNCTHIMSPSR